MDRETVRARQQVQNAETATIQQQDHMMNVEKARWTTTKPETSFDKMLNAIGDSLSDLASRNDEEDGEDRDDEEEDTELGKLSEDDEPRWVMGTFSKMVQHGMESFRQKQIRLDKLTQQEWGDAADYFHEGDMKNGTTELKVLAVGKPQTDTTAATPSQTTFGELMQVLHIIPGQSQMPQVMSHHGTSQMRPGSEKPQPANHIVSLMPNTVPDSLQREIATPGQHMSFHPTL